MLNEIFQLADGVLLPDTATALVEFIEGHVRILIIIAKYSLTEPGVIIFGLIGIALLIKSKVKKILMMLLYFHLSEKNSAHPLFEQIQNHLLLDI